MSSTDTLSRLTFNFTNSYARLPEHFYSRLNPTPVARPKLIKLNVELAGRLGLDPQTLAGPEGVEILAGNRVAEGSEPLAIAYAGHQFGYFVPQLGDGRANLIGEVRDREGVGHDLQLKGSGRTPYSRGGDGRAALGPVLREYLVSEAMAALGVPTTRALAAVTTGEEVFREGPMPGAIFTRVAASHLRVGTFQFFAARNDAEALRVLADYAIHRHYPEGGNAQHRYRALLDGVIGRQARLVAQWMMLGFVHGVMNTDNTSISGETIDYGPCAFMEAYDPDQVFSSIDRQGRYAYSNQPHAVHWNLTRLAEALLPLMVEENGGSEEAGLASAREALGGFTPHFEAARVTGLRRKLGLMTEQEGDAALAERLLQIMAENHTDFTLLFRGLCDAAAGEQGEWTLFADATAYNSWAIEWRHRLSLEPTSNEDRAALMRQVNPAFIPRNHLVEEMIVAAVTRADLQPFEDLLEVVTHPFQENPELQRFITPALPEQLVRHTFCGT